jgi:probable F420-dependent oxidoreductase
MKLGFLFANAGPFADPDLLTHFAVAAEAAGVESLWTVEHVFVPVGYKSQYPYDKSGKMPLGENTPIPDPVLPLAFAAAKTEKIRLATGVMILPQRHPAYVAKQMATLDVLSKGRAILGVGVGWLKEEFDALGVTFETRAERTREAVAAIRSLWRGNAEAFEGKFFRWGPVAAYPTPVQPRGVPIVVGGHTDIAAKRAARYGDGFFPGRGSETELARLVDVMRAECAKVGRDPSEIEITFPLLAQDMDFVRRCRSLGVGRLVTGPPGFDRKTLDSGVADLKKRFLDPVAAG